MQQSTVQGHLVMDLVASPEASVGVAVELAYEPGDPYAVRFTFHPPGGAPVSWVFACELLVAGLSGPAGEGDVRIRPADGEPGGVRIVLHSPEGRALLRAPAAPLTAFLARTERLVPMGRGLTERQLEALLADLLGGGRDAG
ncbi:SsgA family sporulation/cell division regulator [Kitasatospora sp. NPDC001539]|uniref:SsgA family sporulation/cell division regulator n=1 Tax=Kitasatospora sp. NPDC001539 TaxID=3154384 RepID=UPI003319E6AD